MTFGNKGFEVNMVKHSKKMLKAFPLKFKGNKNLSTPMTMDTIAVDDNKKMWLFLIKVAKGLFDSEREDWKHNQVHPHGAEERFEQIGEIDEMLDCAVDNAPMSSADEGLLKHMEQFTDSAFALWCTQKLRGN